LIGYAVLDGFDLGVGILHLFNRDERERRVALNAIGPIWDGNEVWLLTAGGALFAAFPPVYATVFSGFYLALVLLLAALIARAVSLEFRSKVDSPAWKRLWDGAFCVGSLLPALLLGVAFGNILRGVPIDEKGDFAGTFFGLLNPYAILVGLLTVVAFAMHGAIYLAGKSDGEMQKRLQKLIVPLWLVFVLLYVAATAASAFVARFLFQDLAQTPVWLLAPIVLVSLFMIPKLARAGQFGQALLNSSLAIGGMIGLAACGLFPRLVPSLIDPANSLTIHNSSSSPYSLTVMLVIALIGMPLVVGYSIFVYRVFKGKVVLSGESY
jgi:cytochrome d ubiquinol oxidase subunit II